jgi:hypothetical protein
MAVVLVMLVMIPVDCGYGSSSVMLGMIPVDCGYGSSSSDVSYDSSRLWLWQ